MIGKGSGAITKTGLAPVAGADATVLILGSLPGDVSLSQQRYYAHPSNQFWRLLGTVIETDLSAMDYPDRLAMLQRRRIGLWDVIGQAERSGSLDQAIRSPHPNDLERWIAQFRDLRAIAFNGRTAASTGRRALEGSVTIDLIDLPSSSAAHTLAFADKATQWAKLSRYLAD